MAERPPKEPEPDPKGWERFEHAVEAALHTKPKAKPKRAGAK